MEERERGRSEKQRRREVEAGEARTAGGVRGDACLPRASLGYLSVAAGACMRLDLVLRVCVCFACLLRPASAAQCRAPRSGERSSSGRRHGAIWSWLACVRGLVEACCALASLADLCANEQPCSSPRRAGAHRGDRFMG